VKRIKGMSRDAGARWHGPTGRFARSPSGQSWFHPPTILKKIVDSFESSMIDVSEAREGEEIIRKVERWHHYTIEFADTFEVDHADSLFRNHFYPILSKYYKSYTALKCLVGIFSDDGDLLDSKWRNISATFDFDDAFDQIAFNVDEWLSRDEYDVLLGLAAHVRAPEWYERKHGG
jgi:hypothetical protein